MPLADLPTSPVSSGPPGRGDRARTAPGWARRTVATGLLAAASLIGSGAGRTADEIPGHELCRGEIASITFIGNRVTRPEVMQRELPQKIGAPCSLDDVIDGLTRLEDLDLFRSVRVELHPHENHLLAAPASALLPVSLDGGIVPEARFEDEPQDERFDPSVRGVPAPIGGTTVPVELRYVVREKFFFLGLPRLSRTSDGEVRAGISLEWTNFLGRLHELKLVSEWRQEDDGQGRGGFVHSLAYDVPRFFGSDYGMSLRLGAAYKQVDLSRDGIDYGEGQLESSGIGVTLARWLNKSDGVQGLRLFFGGGIRHHEFTVENGELGPIRGGLDLGWRIGLENRAVHSDRYRRRGLRYGGAFSFANDTFGSDFDWHRLDGWAALYRPVGKGLDNLNLSLGVGVSDGAPFGGRFYSIGGGEVLRGVKKGAREGDVRVLLNAEYLSSLYVWPTVRWVLFTDVGNVWDKDEVDLADLKVRSGVGLRWKLEALSRKDLRIDLAWDPDEGRVVPYLATQLTF